VETRRDPTAGIEIVGSDEQLARTTADWQRWMSPGVTFILYDPAGARGIVIEFGRRSWR
jgi:hypothetical protein